MNMVLESDIFFRELLAVSPISLCCNAIHLFEKNDGWRGN
jgi:hypothetical protein